MKYLKYILIIGCFVFETSACKKLVNVNLPSDRLTTNYVFSTPSAVNTAVLNLYVSLGAAESSTIAPNIGYYVDELNNISNGTAANYYTAVLSPTNSLYSNIWVNFYSTIYQANAIIEGLKNNTAIDDATKNRAVGEAEFCRAYSYFYLINFYGQVPLITVTDVNISSLATRTDIGTVYGQIVTDLTDAKNKLLGAYSGEEKVRATKWAASALLSRVYLYQKDWKNAISESANVINSNVFTLQPLNGVFLKNNGEVILQLWNQNGFTIGSGFIPSSPTTAPSYTINPNLLNSFLPGDNRKSSWTVTTIVNGQTYNYLYKYKARVATTGSAAEYYTLLRLAEQYLIKAEAEAQQNDINSAIADLNIIHIRAGLPAISALGLSVAQCDNLIQQERQYELFTENAHRFFDLKRKGTIDQVMQAIRVGWTSNSQLFPIPQSEINADPRLVQNSGY